MDDKKPDVAVGELLREIDDWQYGRSKPTMGLDEAHSLLRRCRAYFLSALPAEPKQDCRAFYGKGRGLCDKCAAGHYEQCRYVAAEPKQPGAHEQKAEMRLREIAGWMPADVAAPPAAEQQKKTTGD